MLVNDAKSPFTAGHSKRVAHYAIKIAKYSYMTNNSIRILYPAALLHDVGKQKLSHGHDKRGEEMLDGLVSERTQWLVKNHMRVWFYLAGKMNKLSSCLDLINHVWFLDLVQLARWDNKAHGGILKSEYSRDEVIMNFLLLKNRIPVN